MALDLQLFNQAPGSFNPLPTPDITQELDRSNSILRDSARVQAQGELNNIALQSKIENDQQAFAFGQLQNFSKTAMDALNAYQQRREKETEAEYYAKALRGEVALGDPVAYQAQKAVENAKDDAISQLSQEALNNGAPPASVMRLYELSGAKRRGAEKGILRLKAMEYNVALNDYSRELGNLPPEQQDAALQNFQREFINKNGLTSFQPEAFVELFGEATLQAQGRAIASARQQYAINTSEEILTAKKEEYEATKDVLGFINGVSGLYTENGAINRGGAWEMWEKTTKGMIDAGLVTLDDIDAMGGQIDPETGKRLDERWKTRFALLRQSVQDEQIEGMRRQDAIDDNAFSEAEQIALQDLGDPNNPPTDDAVDQVQNALWERYRRRSSKLDELKKGFTLDAQQKAEVNEKLKRKAELGILSPEDLQHLPWEIQQKWSSVAAQQSAAPKGEIKAQLDAIENSVWIATRANPAGKLDPIAQLAIGSLQNEFRRRYAEYLQQGIPAASSAERAGGEIVDYFNKSQNTAGGKYFLDPKTGKFANYMKAGNWSGGAKDYLNRLSTIKQVLGTVGWEGAISSPGLFLTEAEAKSLGNTGVFQVPPLVQYYSNKYNRNPIEIINAQRKAMGMKEFDLTPSIQAVQGLDKRAQGLINRFPSPNRFIRAAGGRGGFKNFEPSLVPNGYGQVVQKAAAKYGIPPEILAGILDVESNFNPQAYNSGSIATGIAQIVPKYHPGVNPKDPVASINYAAKYLSELRSQLGGSLNDAIYAYNSGPGAIRQSRENREYFPKVMKASAKYRSNPDLWSSGVLTREKFRVIEHVTGDRTHKNYASDHGGQNYHEHIAFQTKAERDRAIKLYKSLGYRVTSIDRLGDPGYHGKGLAIDVSPPLDLPYDQVSEAQWSKQARAVIGL